MNGRSGVMERVEQEWVEQEWVEDGAAAVILVRVEKDFTTSHSGPI